MNGCETVGGGKERIYLLCLDFFSNNCIDGGVIFWDEEILGRSMFGKGSLYFVLVFGVWEDY